MITKRLLRFLIPLCLTFAAPLLFGAVPAAQEAPVGVSLVAEKQAIQPGSSFLVAVHLKMEKGWDTYWVNPGDAGMPTQVKWDLPKGFKAGPTQWPMPERFSNETFIGYGYTDSVLLITEIQAPKTLEVGSITKIGADVSWLACNEACVPGSAKINLELPVSQEAPAKNTHLAPLFDSARASLPKPLQEQDGQLTALADDRSVVLKYNPAPGSSPDILAATFFPEVPDLIDNGATQELIKESDGYSLTLKRADGASTSPSEVKGVLVVQEKAAGKVAIAIAAPVMSAQGSAAASGGLSLPLALGLAFLGGLILNVMPCVLPVIALKIFSFVKMAHEKRSVVLKHGGAFAAGVIISFWVLSGALLILRAYGEGIGWGFQLQEPVFVVILSLIIFLLGLSLFGLFEMGTSLISLGQKTQATSSRSPLLGSFLSGILATLVATPCTGPLLGPALGFAMTLPTPSALSVFTMMGIGMAAPYLIFSAFPKLVRFLPKPGNWMIIFKQLMGFLMMATVVWLVWVFGAQTSNLAVFMLLASFVVLAIGGWIFGKFALPHKKKRTRLIGTAVAGLIIVFGGGVAISSAKTDASPVISEVESGWEQYSPERVAELQEQGTPVFVDFTAKWCLICQANKVTLHAANVEQAFDKAGVVKMVADWTKRDPVITQELEKLGRSGVPLYVLYPGKQASKPHILPQTLTTSVVTEYINNLQ